MTPERHEPEPLRQEPEPLRQEPEPLRHEPEPLRHEPEPLRHELDRLRRENGALNEQVKLLVRTEQRLYRSQNERDQQLEHVRALVRLAVSCSGLADGEASILVRAADLLRESFHLDGVWTLARTPAGYLRVTAEGAPDAPRGAEAALAGGAEGEAFARWALEQHAIRIGRCVLPEDLRRAAGLPEPARTALVPLIDADGAPLGLILAWKNAATPRSFHRVEVHERHLPYLELLRQHVEAALKNASLAAELHEHGRRLALSNEQLAASLASLERTQQQLLHARKMEAIGRLAGGVAHDFNNLLTVILNHADSLHEASPEASEARESAQRILDASNSAAEITRQLLAFSRKEPRRPTVVDLNALASSMARMLERLLGERIRLELDLASTPTTVRADRAQLEQVLLNLVVNARDAMPEGGTLWIRTRPAQDLEDAPPPAESFFALSVSDTGHGIDDETRAHIFEPFFTTKSVGQGTGLGLAMVYGAVQQNEGHVTVVSREGHGTTFSVFLPRERCPTPLAERPLEDRLPASGATVLLAEDEQRVREVAARILELAGYRVLSAANAEAALELAAHEAAIDLLVTDVIMPGESGARLAERLRARSPSLPVVFLSGYSFDRLDTGGLQPLDEYLQKPFSAAALLARARQALAAAASQPAAP